MPAKLKHTPGPWFVHRNPDGSRNSNNFSVNNSPKCEATFICETLPYQPSGFSEEANARLIAAAPDLLMACRAAFLDLCDEDTIGEHQTTIATLEAALKKAGGAH